MLYLNNYSKLMYTQTDKLILIDPVVFYLGISKQGAGLRSSYYHCRFFFFNRGYVIKRSIYARQYDIPGQFIEHPRGYFHMNVTRVKIRNIEDRPGRGEPFSLFFLRMTNDRPNLVKFDKSHRWKFEKRLVKTFTIFF